jgi:hypothetical protein
MYYIERAGTSRCAPSNISRALAVVLIRVPNRPSRPKEQNNVARVQNILRPAWSRRFNAHPR